MERTVMGGKALNAEFRRRLYQGASVSMAVIFGIVGLLFLLIPENVLHFFNRISPGLGFIESPAGGTGFYLILAVGYMYLVTLLACMMVRHPENPFFPILLINGKAASSVLSFALFFLHHPFLIYVANGIVDGSIAVGVYFLFRKTREKAG
jgi:hypothetical protein